MEIRRIFLLLTVDNVFASLDMFSKSSLPFRFAIHFCPGRPAQTTRSVEALSNSLRLLEFIFLSKFQVSAKCFPMKPVFPISIGTISVYLIV